MAKIDLHGLSPHHRLRGAQNLLKDVILSDAYVERNWREASPANAGYKEEESGSAKRIYQHTDGQNGSDHISIAVGPPVKKKTMENRSKHTQLRQSTYPRGFPFRTEPEFELKLLENWKLK